MITASQLESVFKELYSQLFYLSYDIVGDKHVAQDVISEVFMSLWKNHRDVVYEKLKGYLYISVHNKSLDWCRRHTNITTIPLEELRNLVDGEGESWQSREERIVKIEQAIILLPPKTRQILDLCYRKRKTYKEAAEIMGMSSEGIKKQLYRAIKELRNKLKKEG
jgi:RNA polymerase sigma-70 factor, ECF subfamily